MIVHLRLLAGGVLCRAKRAIIDTSDPKRVTCEDCARRIGNGGDSAAVGRDPDSRGPRSDAAAMAL